MTDPLFKSFNPHETYDGLLKQASAFRLLAESYYYQYKQAMQTVQSYTLTSLLLNSEEIKAHRQTNTILTNSLLEVEEELFRLRSILIEHNIQY